MKRLFALFCMVAVILSTVNTTALAAETSEKVIDLGDGFYVIETITQYPAARSQVVNGEKTDTLYYDSTKLGVVTLIAAFNISGSTVTVQRAGITGTGSNGATYSRGTTSSSGNTASGKAYFKYKGVEKILSISLSCTSDGTLY